eukprot:CAMPEP_0116034538 /NCGR_PEP_ID=MMETSP0321-20121206/19682_1 /TAXON_ID=163516 /ORGANISM="Leptocylindrus danicus var. danicus, Strain B650" /LENGTH=68 /DNA_ID=CAMNT_0003510899 /DNA_START=585 /DNA_END=791 /DNA_ORIENTATION=+
MKRQFNISPTDIPSEDVELKLVYDEHEASRDRPASYKTARTRTMPEIIEADSSATITYADTLDGLLYE